MPESEAQQIEELNQKISNDIAEFKRRRAAREANKQTGQDTGQSTANIEVSGEEDEARRKFERERADIADTIAQMLVLLDSAKANISAGNLRDAESNLTSIYDEADRLSKLNIS